MCNDASSLNGELITPSSVNCSDNARADIHARVSGAGNKVHCLMLRFFIPTHQAIVRPKLLPFFVDTNLRKSGNMGILLVLLMVNLLLHLFSQILVKEATIFF